MKLIISTFLCGISLLSIGQTDIIEMRSRNASMKKYTRNASVETVPSNFGMDPAKHRLSEADLFEISKITAPVLDSLNWVSDSIAIMYTSSQCTNTTPLNHELASIWRPGADTLINHPLFSQNHSLDSVKFVLDNEYMFRDLSDSTKFIGYDNGKENQNSDAVQSVKKKRKPKKNSFGWELLFMITTPIAFVFGMSRLKVI